jgi:hypothetical protein
MLKIFIGFLIAVVLGLVGFTWFTLHWSYSDGERAGFLQKFSRKGWVCKTWEGQMALVTLPGTIAEKFDFTVRDDALAAKLGASIGRRMSVHYEQRKWIPSSCFGDTEYFVTAMQLEEQPQLPPQQSPPPQQLPPPPQQLPPQQSQPPQSQPQPQTQ